MLDDFAGSVGKGFISIAWQDNGLLSGLNNGPRVLRRDLDAIMSYTAPEIENWMKNNASWTDRTGAARNGLAARPFSDGERHGIILFHQVPYGIWLEVRWSGRYAIIVPALEEWGSQTMERAKGLLGRITP